MSTLIGVMTTYRPTAEVVDRALGHLHQLDRLIVVDDGSPDSAVLDALTDDRVEIVRLAHNSGIAAALNTGIRRALELGAEFVLNLDDDSILDPGYVDRLLDAFRRSAAPTRLGVALTDCVNRKPSHPPAFTPEGFGLVNEGIQSGMLISAECLRSVGLMDEALFIDCVDTEFCLRVRDRGWRVVVVPGSNITHSLGRQEPLRPFGLRLRQHGRARTYQYHAPFRQYYITRNNIDLFLRHFRRRPGWALRVLKREIGPHLNAMTSGPHVLKHWLAIAVGNWHGIIRRRGKIPAWLARAVAE